MGRQIDRADIVFHDIQPDELDLQEALISLFQQIFPQYTRYHNQIRQSVRKGRALNPAVLPHHLIVALDDEYIGFALVNYLPRSNIGFGRYVGVKPSHQSRGVGTLIHYWSLEQLTIDAATCGNPTPAGLCVEVEQVETAPDDKERWIREQRLRLFEKRQGGIKLDVDYWEPKVIMGVAEYPIDELADLEPEPMHFFLFPIQPVDGKSDEETRRLVQAVLVDHYRLNKNHPLMKRILASVGRNDREEGGRE